MTVKQYGHRNTVLFSASAGRGGNSSSSSDVSTMDVANEVIDLCEDASRYEENCFSAREASSNVVASVSANILGFVCSDLLDIVFDTSSTRSAEGWNPDSFSLGIFLESSFSVFVSDNRSLWSRRYLKYCRRLALASPSRTTNALFLSATKGYRSRMYIVSARLSKGFVCSARCRLSFGAKFRIKTDVLNRLLRLSLMAAINSCISEFELVVIYGSAAKLDEDVVVESELLDGISYSAESAVISSIGSVSDVLLLRFPETISVAGGFHELKIQLFRN